MMGLEHKEGSMVLNNLEYRQKVLGHLLVCSLCLLLLLVCQLCTVALLVKSAALTLLELAHSPFPMPVGQ